MQMAMVPSTMLQAAGTDAETAVMDAEPLDSWIATRAAPWSSGPSLVTSRTSSTGWPATTTAGCGSVEMDRSVGTATMVHCPRSEVPESEVTVAVTNPPDSGRVEVVVAEPGPHGMVAWSTSITPISSRAFATNSPSKRQSSDQKNSTRTGPAGAVKDADSCGDGPALTGSGPVTHWSPLGAPATGPTGQPPPPLPSSPRSIPKPPLSNSRVPSTRLPVAAAPVIATPSRPLWWMIEPWSAPVPPTDDPTVPSRSTPCPGK